MKDTYTITNNFKSDVQALQDIITKKIEALINAELITL